MGVSTRQTLHTLHSITEKLRAIGNMDLLDGPIHDIATIVCPAQNWLLLLSENDENVYRVHGASSEGRVLRKWQNSEIKLKRGVLRAAIESGDVMYIEDIRNSKYFGGAHDKIWGTGFVCGKSFIVPLWNTTTVVAANGSENGGGGENGSGNGNGEVPPAKPHSRKKVAAAKGRKKAIGLLGLYNAQLADTPEYYCDILRAVGGVLTLVVAQLQSVRDLRRKVLTDHLTGLHNRRALVSIVGRETERCVRYNLPISFVLIDIDNFKALNDTHGHLHGDAVLVRLAQVLLKSVRRLDYAIRFAGDEFVLVMPDTHTTQMTEVIHRVRINFTREKLPSDIDYSISIGAYSGPPQSLQHMFAEADKNMYKEKMSRASRVAMRTVG